ncbi:MAG: aldo/keto reductase [Bacteroidota bacterium]
MDARQKEYSLDERNILREFVDLGRETGMGIMVWSPLASGLLSGKYQPGANGISGEGRLAQLADSGNPAFAKFTDQNWQIVAALEEVSKEIGQPMAAVATNWVANRPGVGSVIVGATKLHQLAANLQALDFEIPAELLTKLNLVSAPATNFPYSFFTPGMQSMLTGGATTGSKPANYAPSHLIAGTPVGVE